jgi:putative Ca2+/H+ antiporter (TMEM165/GDT1 family)
VITTPLTDLTETQPIAATKDVQPSPQTEKTDRSAVIRTFTSTFITIFLAEIGDKTQLATLLISAESQSPWIVFIGAGTALVATSLVGVLLGRYLARVLTPKTLEVAVGTLLMTIAVLLLWDVVQI